MQYSFFSAEDFCRDADFIRWVTSPTPEAEQFWNAFLSAHPHKSEDVQLAKEYIRMIRITETDPDADTLAALRERIWHDIERPAVKHWWKNSYMAAACAVFIILISAWWFVDQRSTNIYYTEYGQIRKIPLADGSWVTLNGRSQIKVRDNIASNKVREIWLDGEAYFEVSKRPGTKFVVHTAETQVEVLGTQFNVNTRRRQTQVVLSEGKVQLISKNNLTSVMKPGDMAIIRKDSQVKLTRVQPDLYDSWKESYLVMVDKPVSEIVEIIEDSYGIHLDFQDSTLLKRKLSGKLQTKNTEDFLDNLSTILDKELIKTDNGYLFR